MKSFVFLLLCVGISNAMQLSDVISMREKVAFKKLLETTPYTDISNAYYAVHAMKALYKGAALQVPLAQAACDSIKSADVSSIDNLFYASETLKMTPTCKYKIPAASVESISKKLSADSDSNTLYKAICILTNAGKHVPADDIIGHLEKAVEKDNSVLSSSYALLASLRLKGVKSYAGLLKSADVEDMAAQSDEVDGQYSHFENDLATTATFLTAAFKASSHIKEVKEIDADQTMLFMNFILRHKSSTSMDKIFYIATSLGSTMNSKTSYLVAKVVSGNSVSKDNPDVKVSVSNVLSIADNTVTVKVESVTRSSDNKEIISNLPLKKDAKSGFFHLKMWDVKPKSGFYDISLNVVPASGAVAGVDELEFKVKVTTMVKITDVKIASLERDATISAANMKSVDFMKKGSELASDTQQKLVMTFRVQDTMDNSYLKPHQVFVRFVHQTTSNEIIFIAEADADSLYKFEVDLNTASKEQFKSQSGKYSMELIVGDAAITNPIQWEVVDVKMKFDESVKKEKEECMYKKKKEIKHLFREKEARPPAVVSTAFTAACLAPFLVLFASWGRVGVNLSNLSLAPANLIFHIGLGAIFFTYYRFWTQINMFCTIQYLLGIGLITFIAGNKVLSKIAAQRE